MQVNEFWRERQELYGGEILHRTVARYLGSSGEDESRELSGLLFFTGKELVFEDFEKQEGFLGLLIRRNRPKYVKTILRTPVEDIVSVRRVSQRGASAKLKGDPAPVREITRLESFLSIAIHEVNLNSGSALYFELLDGAPLEKILP